MHGSERCLFPIPLFVLLSRNPSRSTSKMRLLPRVVLSVLFGVALTAHLPAQATGQPPVNASVPGPFQFREVYPLEFRVDTRKEPYDPNTAQQLSTTNYGLA